MPDPKVSTVSRVARDIEGEENVVEGGWRGGWVCEPMSCDSHVYMGMSKTNVYKSCEN